MYQIFGGYFFLSFPRLNLIFSFFFFANSVLFLRFLFVLSKIQYFHGEIFEELFGLSAENIFCDFLNSFLSSFPYEKLVLNLRNLEPKAHIIFEEKAVDNFQDIFEIGTYGLLLYIQKLGNQKTFITTHPPTRKRKDKFCSCSQLLLPFVLAAPPPQGGFAAVCHMRNLSLNSSSVAKNSVFLNQKSRRIIMT